MRVLLSLTMMLALTLGHGAMAQEKIAKEVTEIPACMKEQPEITRSEVERLGLAQKLDSVEKTIRSIAVYIGDQAQYDFFVVSCGTKIEIGHRYEDKYNVYIPVAYLKAYKPDL